VLTKRREISEAFSSFLRLLALCGAIILASWLIFWAVNNPVSNVPDLFIYVLAQVNLTVLLLHPLKFLYEEQRVRYHWPLHIMAIFAVNCLVVVTSAGLIYRVDGLRLPFLNFLQQSWKFPFVANLVFAFAYETSKVTTCRLKRHNRKLQETIEIEAAEREVEAEELKQAHDIQRGLLPKQIPQLPPFEISGAWEPARVVGGDYYDVIRIGKTKLAICIADVAGKGISAALLMANVQAAVRAFASQCSLPSQVCAQINSVLCTNTAPEKFVTLFYGVLDAQSRTLQYCNAGHPCPVLVHNKGGMAPLESNGALLGVFPNWIYQDSMVELPPGDLLLLFTDGITEAMSPEGEEFGEQRMLAVLASRNSRPLGELQSQLLGNVKDFSSSKLRDDATLIFVATSLATPPSESISGNQISSKPHTKESVTYAGVLS
jgi:sigma-B regulation protein RsbU (phosphoserine phosphatase)